MTALLLLLTAPLLMWIAQTITLRRHALPVRWRIDAHGAPRDVRTVGRAITQLSLFAVIVAYPLIRHRAPVEYYASLLPSSRSALQLIHGAAAAILFLSVLFLAWLATERLTVQPHQSRKRLIRRLLVLVPTSLFGATVEEFLFRGVVMADVLRSVPSRPFFAVAVSAIVFSVAHYVRAVKRHWTFPGHIALGLLLSLAFLQTGSLWLPIGLHAGGIFMIMGTRPFFEYRGPAWLTGASIFPFAGVIGMVGLGLLTAFIMTYYGVR
jgi:membrane protease YdiL (CAAX protease family)